MENQENKTFEVGKFYRICSSSVYPMQQKKEIPHRVVRKTKTKIVLEYLYKTLAGDIQKVQRSFRLGTMNGWEEAWDNEKWSMIPAMHPNKPCEKPAIWDTVGNGETKAKADK